MSAPTVGAAQAAVPSEVYSQELLIAFSGGDEFHAFIAGGGEPLRPRIQRALELANLKPGLRVLDLGCGRGEAAVHLLRAGCAVVASDYSIEATRLTRSTVTTLEPAARSIVYLQSDGAALPLPDASVDRVLMLDVVEHMPPAVLNATLREARRVLRPGGRLVIHTVPNRWALQFGYPLLRLLLGRRLPATPRNSWEPDVHVNEQDVRRLRGALTRANLRHRVWLADLTSQQARFQGDRRAFGDVRDGAYALLRQPWVSRLVGLVTRTPARYILTNDIFAVAWRD